MTNGQMIFILSAIGIVMYGFGIVTGLFIAQLVIVSVG